MGNIGSGLVLPERMSSQGRGQKVGALFSAIHERAAARMLQRTGPPLNVLMLYATNASFTGTVTDHLNSFRRFSRHNFYYADAVNNAPCHVDLELFDAVVIHYSCGLY